MRYKVLACSWAKTDINSCFGGMKRILSQVSDKALFLGAIFLSVKKVAGQGGFAPPIVSSFISENVNETFNNGSILGRFNVLGIEKRDPCFLNGKITDIAYLNASTVVKSSQDLLRKSGQYAFSYFCKNAFGIPSSTFYGSLTVADIEFAPTLKVEDFTNVTSSMDSGTIIGSLQVCDDDGDYISLIYPEKPSWLRFSNDTVQGFCSNFTAQITKPGISIASGIYEFLLKASDSFGLNSSSERVSFTVNNPANDDIAQSESSLFLIGLISIGSVSLLCCLGLVLRVILHKRKAKQPSIQLQRVDKTFTLNLENKSKSGQVI